MAQFLPIIEPLDVYTLPKAINQANADQRATTIRCQKLWSPILNAAIYRP